MPNGGRRTCRGCGGYCWSITNVCGACRSINKGGSFARSISYLYRERARRIERATKWNSGNNERCS
jgi:hypothetical protein